MTVRYKVLLTSDRIVSGTAQDIVGSSSTCRQIPSVAEDGLQLMVHWKV